MSQDNLAVQFLEILIGICSIVADLLGLFIEPKCSIKSKSTREEIGSYKTDSTLLFWKLGILQLEKTFFHHIMQEMTYCIKLAKLFFSLLMLLMVLSSLKIKSGKQLMRFMGQ